jgi:predicted nucleic acid-binding protein
MFVDSSGWLEYFADGPNADFFTTAIKDADNLVVPSIVILEVFKIVLRERGEGLAFQYTLQMQQGLVVPLGTGLARAAARCGLDSKLALADSIIWATAQAYDAVLWTQDAHFQHLNPVRFIAKR